MKPNAFVKAILMEPPKICGLQLLPFSAWHAVVLDTIESPYAVGGRDPVDMDLIIAVEVCCGRFGKSLSRIERLHDKMGLLWQLRRLCYPLRAESWKMLKYVNEYVDLPKVWTAATAGQGVGKRSGCPFFFGLVAGVLRDHAGITEAEAWNMPVNRLGCYRASAGESNGCLDVLSGDAEAIIDKIHSAGLQEAEDVCRN